jgi:hypothetical protein
MIDAGLDIKVCPIPVKTEVGQVDLVSWLSGQDKWKKWLSYLLEVIFNNKNVLLCNFDKTKTS